MTVTLTFLGSEIESFSDIQEAKKFLSADFNFWKPLILEVLPNNQKINNAINFIYGTNNAHQNISDLQEYSKNILHPNDNKMTFVKSKTSDIQFFKGFYSYINSSAIQHNSRDYSHIKFTDGYLTAFLMENGLNLEFIHQQQEKLSKLFIEKRNESDKLIDEIKKESDSLCFENSEFKSKIQSWFDVKQKEFDDSFAEIQKKHESISKEMEASFAEKIEEFESTMKKKVVFKASTEFFSTMKKWAFWKSWGWGILALSSLCYAIHFIIKFYPSIEQLVTKGGDNWHLAYFYIILLAFPTFWAIRIFVRLWFSNVQTYQSSKEKIVMLETYLALINDQKIKDGDKANLLILEALFRHAQTGIVKDDASPSAIAAFLEKVRN
jgi:hypothetical protein